MWQRHLVCRDGAGASPLADGSNVFGASDAERLSGSKFRDKNFRRELLFRSDRLRPKAG